MNETIRRQDGGRRPAILELLILVVLALLMIAFFSPALPRLDLPFLSSAKGTPLFLGVLALLLSYYAFRRRKDVARAWKWGLVFVGILLLLAVTRVPYLLYHQASLNSDRSVTLLMVENIAQGTSFPIYFYGRLYQGSLDAYLYALVHRWVAPPVLSVLVGNLLLLSVFVLFGASLVNRIADSSSLFYPVLILSLPVGALLFVFMDQVHGFALVACLLGILMFLVFRAAFEKREGFLWIGLVAGLLFWSYQPSLIWIAVLLAWLVGSLIRTYRWRAVAKALASTGIGFCVGALPHILSEIHNGFVNTRSFFLGPERARLSFVEVGSSMVAALSALLRLDSSVAGEAPWYGVVFLSLCGLLVCLHRTFQRQELKWMYLPVLFGASLGVLSLSGFPPVERYLVHYRFYGLFPTLLAALACQSIAFLDRRRIRGGMVVVFVLLTAGKSATVHRRLADLHAESRATIEALRATREGIILGDYWNTVRFAPFLWHDRILTAAPSLRYPNAVFDAAKYYPRALELGERWQREDKGFLSRHSERRRIERLLRGLDVGFSSDAVGGYVFYSGFSSGLSAALSAVLVEGSDAESLIRSGSYRTLRQRLGGLPEPIVEGGSIVLPGLAEQEDPPQEGLRHGWQYVLDGEGTRITVPLDPMRSRGYALPPDVGFDGGDYEASLHYLGRPVHDYGRISLSGKTGRLVLSQIRDETTFVSSEGFGARSGRVGLTGLPLTGLVLNVRDEEIQALELHVYSLFDFGSSLWTNRYQQLLIVNGKEIPLNYGENTISLPVTARRTFRMDTRYKTLLTARDSQDGPAFHNVGAVLRRVTLHAEDSSFEVVPFLRERHTRP